MNRQQITIVLTLSFLTALEPLSIDLFLPAFTQMAEKFNTSSANVQMSLSTFLAGFAIGQLIWGPLADRYGRKKPLLISLALFTLSSAACIYASTIEQYYSHPAAATCQKLNKHPSMSTHYCVLHQIISKAPFLSCTWEQKLDS